MTASINERMAAQRWRGRAATVPLLATLLGALLLWGICTPPAQARTERSLAGLVAELQQARREAQNAASGARAVLAAGSNDRARAAYLYRVSRQAFAGIHAQVQRAAAGGGVDDQGFRRQLSSALRQQLTFTVHLRESLKRLPDPGRPGVAGLRAALDHIDLPQLLGAISEGFVSLSMLQQAAPAGSVVDAAALDWRAFDDLPAALPDSIQ